MNDYDETRLRDMLWTSKFDFEGFSGGQQAGSKRTARMPSLLEQQLTAILSDDNQ